MHLEIIECIFFFLFSPIPSLCASFYSVLQGHEATISALLACPRVDPNMMARGAPPVAIAAHQGRLPALALLLRDPRVNPNQATARVCASN